MSYEFGEAATLAAAYVVLTTIAVRFGGPSRQVTLLRVPSSGVRPRAHVAPPRSFRAAWARRHRSLRFGSLAVVVLIAVVALASCGT